MLVHTAKHYFAGGTGIRTFLDFYVYLNRFGDTLDFDYIKAECKKIELSDFECEVRLLANTVFSGNPYVLTEAQEKMLSFSFESGAYGNYKNILIGKLNAINSNNNQPISKLKGKYVFRRIFPDLKYMQTYYSILNKCKYLLPLIWIYRLVYKSLINFKGACKELKALKKSNNLKGKISLMYDCTLCLFYHFLMILPKNSC